MKRKWIGILMAGVVLSSVCGCSGGNDTAEKPKASESVAGDEKKEENVEENMEESAGEATIEQQVLCDQNGIKITADGLEKTEKTGSYELKLTIENNSDKNIALLNKDLIVNDYVIKHELKGLKEPSEMDFSMEHMVWEAAGELDEVSSGETAGMDIDIYNSYLEEAGITSVGKIELALVVYDTESFKGIFQTKLTEIPTSEYGKVNSEAPSGTEFFNQDEVRIIGYEMNRDEENQQYIMQFYVENNSKNDIEVSVLNSNEIKENALSISSTTVGSVTAGKKAVREVKFSYSIEEDDVENPEADPKVVERKNIILFCSKMMQTNDGYSTEKIGYSEAFPISSLE